MQKPQALFSVMPNTNGLVPHELLALTLIFQEQFSGGTNIWSLTQDMQKSGYIKVATSLAVTGLKQKNYIHVQEVRGYDGPEDNFFVTAEGEQWLILNQHKLNLLLTAQPAPEITDDDIPF